MARVRGAQIYSPEVLEELKKAMEESPREGVDDEMTFKQKMNALQRFLNHGMSRFSIDTWHHALSDLFYSYQQAHFDDGRLDGQALTKVTSVSHLRALSRDVILHREGGSMRETDAHGLKYLENFLAAVQCLKEAKACVDSVFQYMYYNYYDPDAGKSKESSSVHSAKTRRHAAENENHVMTATDVRDLQLDASSFGILTLEQMTGSTQHKLRRTVSDMKEIMSRWDHLQTEDEIHLDDLDPESQQDLLMLHGTASFEQVLRLLPDIFAKYYKCLELAKQWWVLAHEIYPELPMGRQPTPDIISPQDSEGGSEGRSESRSEDAVTDSRQSPVNQMSEHNAPSTEELEAVLEEIQKKEELLQSLQDELDMLEERERHFESLVETYENVTAQLENKIREKKELATARERQTQLGVGESFQEGGADNRSSGRHRRESADSSQSLDAQIEKSEREIQLLQFQQALLLQDYMIQLEVRPSLIRFTEDLKLRIQDAHQGLTEHKTEKSRLENLAQNADASEKREDDAKTVSMTDPSSPRDDLNEDESPPPPPAKKPTNSKSTERKLELSRLQARPRREDTSGSDVISSEGAAPVAASPVKEAKRRVSLPQGRKEVQERTKAGDTHSNTNLAPPSKGAPSRPPKEASGTAGKPPRVQPLSTSVAPAKQANHNTAAEAGKHQEQPEPLFQRRARRKQAAASSTLTGGKTAEVEDSKTEQQRPQQHQQPQPTRPRAKSDPHAASRTDPKPARKDSRALRRQKTSDSDKLGQQTKKELGTPAPKPKAQTTGVRDKDKAAQPNGDVGTTRKKHNYANV